MTINAEPGGRGKGGRRRKGHAVHGWLILDKPSGVTSTAAVGRARRLLDAAKAGHGGTLDPLAIAKQMLLITRPTMPQRVKRFSLNTFKLF